MAEPTGNQLLAGEEVFQRERQAAVFYASLAYHLWQGSAWWGGFRTLELAKKEAARLESLFSISNPRAHRQYTVQDAKGSPVWSHENREKREKER